MQLSQEVQDVLHLVSLPLADLEIIPKDIFPADHWKPVLYPV